MPHVTREIELVLRIDLDAEPIAGSLTTAGGACEQFRGWIGLSAALEHVRAGEAQPLDPSGHD